MIDLETLGIGEKPAILSIGAVVFNDDQIIAHFDVGIDRESCIKQGFSVSPDTLAWWEQQDPEAKAVAFSGVYEINIALKALCEFYRKYECSEIWSKGALADIRWINNALAHFDMKSPWKYYSEMCFRTF